MNAHLIKERIASFVSKLSDKLNGLKLDNILERKNPYLYCALGFDAEQLISNLVEAHASSSAETIFGQEVLEPLAIRCSVGVKATTFGVDILLESSRKRIAYPVAVKSGVNIFNSTSKKAQLRDLAAAKKTLLQGHLYADVSPMIGYCYGKKCKFSTVIEIAGQSFWAFLTGDGEYYLVLTDLISKVADGSKAEYKRVVDAAKVRLLAEFNQRYLNNGQIDWRRITRLNSAWTCSYRYSVCRDGQEFSGVVERRSVEAVRKHLRAAHKVNFTKKQLSELTWEEMPPVIMQGLQAKLADG
jgi:hypothetical protein